MNRRASFLFIALGLAWGVPYLLIKIAGAEMTPSFLVLARTALAALLLLPLVLLRPAARRQVPAVLRRWPALSVYAVIEIVGPWIFLTRAEQQLPSSTAALLVSAVPVAGVVIAFLGGRAERLGTRGWAGLALGTAGVAALVGFDVAGSDLGAVAEMGVVVVGYALGPAIMHRWLGDLPGLHVVTASLVLAALACVPFVVLGPGLPDAVPSTGALAAVGGLVVVCTAAAFLMLFALVREIGPVRATAIVYVNPVVAVLAGALLLGEHVTPWTLAGFALVLVGSVLVTRRAPGDRPAPVADPSATPLAVPVQAERPARETEVVTVER